MEPISPAYYRVMKFSVCGTDIRGRGQMVPKALTGNLLCAVVKEGL